MPRFHDPIWLRIFREGEGAGGGGSGGEGGAAGDTDQGAGGTPPAPDGSASPPPASSFDWNAWREGLTDESKKAYAKGFKDPDALLDGALNLRREISTRIKVPGKDAKPEEVAAFRAAIGAKEKAEEYKVATPENYEMGEVQTALASSMQQAAAEAGVPAAAFESFTKKYFEFEQQVQAKVAEEVDTFLRESEAQLKRDFGTSYDQKAQAAKRFVEQSLQVPEFNQLLEETVTWNGKAIQLGSHPAVIKMLASIGERTAEDGVIGFQTEAEAKSLRDTIRELEQRHPIGQRTREQDAQIQALYQKLYG